MLVADLRHFLELTDTTPAPARRLAGQLASVVRAATSRPAGRAWVTALSCGRRPGHRPCTGRIEVLRNDLPGSIRWRCSDCGDDGVINGWERSPFDLRPTGAPEPSEVSVTVSSEVIEILRTVMPLDVECERMVFGARLVDGSILVNGSVDELDSLIDSVAAEANHEQNRRRQRRLDAAYDALGQPNER